MDADEAARLETLARLVARFAAGDYSQKPAIDEADDAIGRLSVAVRFLLDDLESAREATRGQIAQLESANAQLKELAAARARFINTAAHELNTPLTPIRLQMHTLRGGHLGPLTERQLAAIDLFDRNLARIGGLVRDFLDAARLQSDKLAIAPRPLRLEEVVSVAVDVVRSQAEEAGITLEARLGEAPILEADADRITQVLLNLLTNALKFTPRGGRVDVTLSADAHDVVVRVRDTGPGLSAQQQAKLFQPFSQVHDAMQRTRSGTGLGLYISRGIIEQHSGHLWVESDGPGKGSTFAFALPRAPHRVMAPESAPQLDLVPAARSLRRAS